VAEEPLRRIIYETEKEPRLSSPAKLLVVLLLIVACALSAQSEAQQPTVSEKLEELYFKTLDDWVARGGQIDEVQKSVVETCGKLVMWAASAREKIGFMASQRSEFDFRVDVCMKMTVNRVHKQPEFEKPELVQTICDKSGILLFTKLCKRSGLR
jgi:hypothetical protein